MDCGIGSIEVGSLGRPCRIIDLVQDQALDLLHLQAHTHLSTVTTKAMNRPAGRRPSCSCVKPLLFQQPSIFLNKSTSGKATSSSSQCKRALHVKPYRFLSFLRSSAPPRIPRVPIPTRGRSVVVAWLTDHCNASVTCAANSSGSQVVTLRGVLHDIIPLAIRTRASHVYLSSQSASTETVLALLYSNLIAVPVTAHGFLNCASPLQAPLFTASAVATPLLVERKGDSTLRFFEQSTESAKFDDDKGLRCEKESDNRPLIERITSYLTRIYLPRGYPHTTTPDYISFTKYRTIQNLASSIMSVISTKALLFGLGLGQKVAAGAAATSWVLKDGLSYVAKIGYGSSFGAKFDDDPKSWRIAADIVEDFGGAMEILTPLFPRAYFLLLASLSHSLRGMSLMTGTATRHVVYRSLAAQGMQNTGDIATKGESQGVTCKMIGLAIGIILSSRIGQNYYALLGAYTLLASVHIAANWKSVQCVQFSFLNKQRASILLDNFLLGQQMPSPYDVSHHEQIILPPWRGFDPSVHMGANVRKHAHKLTPANLERAKHIFRGERFLIVTNGGDRGDVDNKKKQYAVFLRQSASSMDALKAYYVIKYMRSNPGNPGQNTGRKVQTEEQLFLSALIHMRRNITTFTRNVERAGWDTRHILLNGSQTRVDW